ncbi:sialic acid-specific 9-O-acetylesterase [Lentisphaera araneosa HTCC2155]|uniref:Sialic acid-specific 9-O-acetylesterase n=1 Tax=Lentisphaera araneosa HTCC2155 TaxID=313628 RepID=A6DFN7_9BACT|nr:sialic acid-specific 9-O-acetylesterase [Lentisphaera araneosa]EDM29617.1 sialic acid-specific 9-O-acetylesterase [Lentisphaera araneosa HTCC2155]
MKKIILLGLVAVNSIFAGTLSLSKVFSDHMVLQRGESTIIWGKAAEGELVKLQFRGKNFTTKSVNGLWKILFEPGLAGGPFELKLATDSKKVHLKDVMVGDVWLCSGQSNMAWRAGAYAKNVQGMENKIRLFMVKESAELMSVSKADLNRDVKVGMSWSPCTPKNSVAFSGVGLNFALRLQQDIDVPIGLIHCAVGGSRIECWMSENELLKEAQTEKLMRNFLNNIKAGERFTANRSIAALYNTMLKPLIGFKIKGVLWYQGEANRRQGSQYKDLLKRLISEWRDQWGQGDFPFYYVQIAPFDYGKMLFTSNQLRESQYLMQDELKNLGVAVINDVGDWKNLHPKNKHDVGKRLALLALNRTYGKKEVLCTGPRVMKINFQGKKAIIEFDQELKIQKGEELKGLELASENQIFYHAKGEIKGKVLIVRADEIDKAVAIRYGWTNKSADFPLNLAGVSSLPVSLFRSDRWKE